MSDLIKFLHARLDEDRAVAEAAPAGPWEAASGDGEAWRVWGGFTADERFNWATDTREITTRREEVAGPGLGVGGVRSEGTAVHMARHDPARALAEVDAKRRTLVRCEEALLAASPMLVHFARQTLHEMALPYADHPDYRDEWRA